MTGADAEEPPGQTRKDAEPFVPADFSPPRGLDHPQFRLRPLGPDTMSATMRRGWAPWTTPVRPRVSGLRVAATPVTRPEPRVFADAPRPLPRQSRLHVHGARSPWPRRSRRGHR